MIEHGLGVCMLHLNAFCCCRVTLHSAAMQSGHCHTHHMVASYDTSLDCSHITRTKLALLLKNTADLTLTSENLPVFD